MSNEKTPLEQAREALRKSSSFMTGAIEILAEQGSCSGDEEDEEQVAAWREDLKAVDAALARLDAEPARTAEEERADVVAFLRSDEGDDACDGDPAYAIETGHHVGAAKRAKGGG